MVPGHGASPSFHSTVQRHIGTLQGSLNFTLSWNQVEGLWKQLVRAVVNKGTMEWSGRLCLNGPEDSINVYCPFIKS